MTTRRDRPLTAAVAGPLSGFTVVLTAHRRAEEFVASFTRLGATVLRAPILRIVPACTDDELAAATGRIVADPPDDVVVTTAIGFHRWIEAADAHGWADDLHRVLSRSPGEVVDRHRLLATMPGASDLHTVEVAVARLRAGIGRSGVVETVVKRGYRIAVVDR